MPFCSHCGIQVNDGVNFCPKCGKPVGNSNAVVNNQSSNPVRSSNVKAEAVRLYDYFIAKKDLFDEGVSLLVEKNNASVPKRLYLILLLFTWIPAVFIESGPEFVGWILIAVWIALFVALIVRRKKKMNELDERLAYIDERTTEIFNYLDNYYNTYGDCPVGIDYVWPETLEKITDYIMSGRADSFKEAISIYHQQEQIDEMQDKMDEMVYNTKMASIKAGNAAHYAAMNYYFKD